MTACRSCGAPVRWAKTAKGKAMPLDAAPLAGGNVRLDQAGVAVVMGPQEASAWGGEAYTSHFAICPQGREWRRGA